MTSSAIFERQMGAQGLLPERLGVGTAFAHVDLVAS